MANIRGRQDSDRVDPSENAIVGDGHPVPAWLEGDRAAVLTVSRSVYSRKAVLATAYKFSDRYAVLVDTDGDDRWALFIVAVDPVDLRPILAAVVKELADQALREQLEQEFAPVRNLIVAHAFSEGNLLDASSHDNEDGPDA